MGRPPPSGCGLSHRTIDVRSRETCVGVVYLMRFLKHCEATCRRLGLVQGERSSGPLVQNKAGPMGKMAFHKAEKCDSGRRVWESNPSGTAPSDPPAVLKTVRPTGASTRPCTVASSHFPSSMSSSCIYNTCPRLFLLALLCSMCYTQFLEAILCRSATQVAMKINHPHDRLLHLPFS